MLGLKGALVIKIPHLTNHVILWQFAVMLQHVSGERYDMKWKDRNSSATRLILETLQRRIEFSKNLASFNSQQRCPVTRIPHVGGVDIDLYTMFLCVVSRGGYQQVSSSYRWVEVGRVLGMGPTCTNTSYLTKTHYEKYLLKYENHIRRTDEEYFTKVTLVEDTMADTPIAAGCRGNRLTTAEYQYLPVLASAPNYMLELRNLVLFRWALDVTRAMTATEALAGIPADFQGDATCIFRFLTLFGFINSGIVDISEVVASPEFKDVRDSVAKSGQIVVIGAGAAGIACARHLSQFGMKVVVVEGKNRLGGRVWSTDHFSKTVDVGASIITGLKGNPMDALRQQAGLAIHRLSQVCPLFFSHGEKVSLDLDDKASATYNKALDEAMRGRLLSIKRAAHPLARLDGGAQGERIEDLSLNSNDTSLGESLRSKLLAISKKLPPEEQCLIEWHTANLEYGCAASLSKVSSMEWDQDDVHDFDGDHAIFSGGQSQLLDTLAHGLDVSIDRVVECVRHNDASVSVICKDGTIVEGSCCVSTLPIGVLQADSVRFEPPLPEWKRNCISRIGAGLLNKVILEFPSCFWPQDVDMFGRVPSKDGLRDLKSAEWIHDESRGRYFMFWDLRRPTGACVLTSLVCGKAAIDMEGESDEEVVAQVLGALRSMFGDQVPEPIKYVVTRWGADTMARCAYSYLPIGSCGRMYESMSQPVGNIYFAGEATHREHATTVAGAILSGWREAGRILSKSIQIEAPKKAGSRPSQGCFTILYDDDLHNQLKSTKKRKKRKRF